MTNEEAKDLLDNLIGMVEDNQNNDYDEALKLGIEALEKQIPKNTILVTRSGGIIKFYPCPSCSTSEKYVSVYPSMKFCTNCGQALKWE